MTLGRTSLVDKREALARNQIELHQPEKLPELVAIEKVADPESRSVQAQMLLHSGSVDGMKSVLTSNFPALQNVDAHGLESVINIYRANPTSEARSALIRLMPVLGRLPEGARNHALEQLNSMMPQDLQRTAQRLAESPIAWMSANDDAAGVPKAPGLNPSKSLSSDGPPAPKVTYTDAGGDGPHPYGGITIKQSGDVHVTTGRRPGGRPSHQDLMNNQFGRLQIGERRFGIEGGAGSALVTKTSGSTGFPTRSDLPAIERALAEAGRLEGAIVHVMEGSVPMALRWTGAGWERIE